VKARGRGHHIQRCADGDKTGQPPRRIIKIQNHVQRCRTAKGMRHHEKRHARVQRAGSVNKGDEIGPGAGIIGAARQRTPRTRTAHIHPQQAEARIQYRPDQPQDMRCIHTAIQPMNRDDTAA